MTYELPAQFIVKRILAYKSELTLGQLIGGVRSKEKISDEDIVKLETLIERLEDNIFICDAAGMNIAESAAFVKSEIESKGISSAYFDYVQIIRTADGRVPDKESDFASISFILRELAASQQIPVVAAAQLNREVEKRKDKRPVLSDLRSSGSLENDARVVLGLYRDEYYNKFSEDKDILEISILKNTNGELNTLRTFFNKPKCTILELEENREEPNDAYTSKNRFHQSEPDIPDVEESDFSAWES
jgi:replicative DNA helicase